VLGRRSALAFVATLVAGSVLTAAPAYATGSITSPGAAVAVGVSPAEWSAFLAGHAELTGASVAAPIGSAVATAGATLAGSAVVSGDGLGGITGLLGGIKDWLFGVPEASDPGLPAGATGVGSNGSYGAITFHIGPATVSATSPYAYSVAYTLTVPSGCSTGYGWGLSWGGITAGGTTVGTQQWNKGLVGGTGAACAGTHTGTFTGTLGSTWITSYGALPAAARPYFYQQYYASSTPVTASPAGGDAQFNATGNPARTIEQTITCKNAAGVTSTVTSTTASALWAPSEMVEVAGLMCPLGKRAVGVVATVKTPGGADLVVVNEPYVEGTGWDAATADIPEPCYSGTTCHLELERKTGSDTWTATDPASVPNWWTDPLRDSTYRCMYGAGSTWVNLGLAACEVYKSPETGLATPTLVTDPPPSDPSGDCSFGWLDLLNGEIFVRGSMCVVRWATIPTPGRLDTAGANISDAFDASAAGTAVAAVSNVGGSFTTPVAGDCHGPEFGLSWIPIASFDGVTIYPMEACTGIGQLASSWFRPVALVALWGAALMSAFFMVASAFDLDQD
jgi:hypothetical protein